MAKPCYCPMCQRPVQPKKFSWIIFLLLCCIGFIPGIIYLVACHGKKCPICGCKL